MFSFVPNPVKIEQNSRFPKLVWNFFGKINTLVAGGFGCVHLGVAFLSFFDTPDQNKHKHTLLEETKIKHTHTHLKLVEFFRRPCKKRSTPWFTHQYSIVRKPTTPPPPRKKKERTMEELNRSIHHTQRNERSTSGRRTIAQRERESESRRK